MAENQQTDTSTFPPDAAALYQRMQEDPETALQEAFASDNKDSLNWLLNNASEFRPVGSVPATILGWTEGTGVWVLEGTKESHRGYGRICDENPGIEHNEALKKAGATYYENCKFGALNQETSSHTDYGIDKDYDPALEGFAGKEGNEQGNQV